jgi:hypothetical protein
MSRKKTTKDWRTKDVGGKRMMICQNSDLEHSKYPDWSPNEGDDVCKEWSEVGSDTTAVLCADCTRRSLHL